MFNKDLFIIDDFYDKPLEMRKIALECDYLQFQNNNVPGYESEHSYFNNAYQKKFADIIGEPIVVNHERLTYGKFRYSLENSKSNSSMHVDRATWSALVYLTLDEHCKGGLGIYKHIETGISCIPENQNDLERLGFSNYLELDKEIVSPDTNDFSKWELLQFIPMKFNRAIIFKGSKYFHSVTEKFGDSIENSRLSHNFFFNSEINIK